MPHKPLSERQTGCWTQFQGPFASQILDTRRSEIMEELLDLLLSFVDFQAFKELMLAHKSQSVTSYIHVRAQDGSVFFYSSMPTQASCMTSPGWQSIHHAIMSDRHVQFQDLQTTRNKLALPHAAHWQPTQPHRGTQGTDGLFCQCTTLYFLSVCGMAL